jgi:hypothetical protein
LVHRQEFRGQYTNFHAAHPLIAVLNGAGERIEYTLDALGNRAQEVVKSGTGQIVNTMSRTHDYLGRRRRSTGSATKASPARLSRLTSANDAYNYDAAGGRGRGFEEP